MATSFISAALDDFKKRAMDADILKTILIRLRKLAREYSLPDTVTGALNSVNEREYRSKLVNFYQKVGLITLSLFHNFIKSLRIFEIQVVRV